MSEVQYIVAVPLGLVVMMGVFVLAYLVVSERYASRSKVVAPAKPYAFSDPPVPTESTAADATAMPDVIWVRSALRKILATEQSPVVAKVESCRLAYQWMVAEPDVQRAVVKEIKADLAEIPDAHASRKGEG